jgi:cation transport ATPase
LWKTVQRHRGTGEHRAKQQTAGRKRNADHVQDKSDLTGVAAIAFSRYTMRVMSQNLFWEFCQCCYEQPAVAPV